MVVGPGPVQREAGGPQPQVPSTVERSGGSGNPARFQFLGVIHYPMKTLPVHGKMGQGMEAIVSDEDYDRFVGFRWYLCNGYPVRRHNEKISPGVSRKHQISLHREVMGCSIDDGIIVDHINRNKLDARRENLRKATPSENSRNNGGWGKSGVKGVYPARTHSRYIKKDGTARKYNHYGWKVEVRIEGISYRKGSYKKLEDAVRARNDLLRTHGYQDPEKFGF